ncbi:hypothetical protein HV824_28120 [Myxococcus sp. AM009]|uniref:hypothetical protein n=1 Tax=unclassified Myxococcus TaxID=2648731 RepID=UPI001595240F|nr:MULTISPECIES: hypothetical protein [unclassified Myxococcus]NVJ01967.1 hypothetical protein [Myxococcus sp. AM009]NVJ17574.1 hypothetical protein [Myxococcus sp. AM010]
MQPQGGKRFRQLTVTLAALALAVVTVTGAARFFGGTKIGRLTQMSAEELAGGPTVLKSFDTADAGTPRVQDAGDAATLATPPAP